MYESFYGLSGKPFQLNPDPSFFFGSKGHRRALAYLEYGLHQSEGFIVITGEIGAGKTTLVRSLLQKLDAKKVVAAQLVSTHLDAEDTLRLVAAAFGLPNKQLKKADLLLSIEMFLLSLTAAGKRALLIVDEAQNLTPRAVEELRMLSNFQLGEHALLQSFLVGQPEFRETMQSPHMEQLRQRVIASYHLGPMDAQETEAYIEHRLKHVGWRGSPAFRNGAHEAIFAATEGVPRRINTLCDRLMLGGFLSGATSFSDEDVAGVVSEIRDEAGDAAAAAAMAKSGDRGRTDDGDHRASFGGSRLIAAPDLFDMDLSQFKLDADSAQRVRDFVNAHQAGCLEDRLSRIERTLEQTIAMLGELAERSLTPDADATLPAGKESE
ncbi:MAG: XrtA-associated ATPase [Gammaproteobacteria bacterium]|nr:XrtA-associated ATPase [Gammaproteobacteria bacterium]MBU0770628.1 XrtA-associated ATPase [Gammaproteobacteria bacterium]MBU0856200.1 XrtA-associated ATPase [Gammaproteobacteria bacterium]MBU1845613.1 XrtA-associated ATPase [Gammaproteobacteria bacterium]